MKGRFLVGPGTSNLAKSPQTSRAVWKLLSITPTECCCWNIQYLWHTWACINSRYHHKVIKERDMFEKVWLGRDTTRRHHKTMEGMDQVNTKDECIHTNKMCHKDKAQRNLSTWFFRCKYEYHLYWICVITTTKDGKRVQNLLVTKSVIAAKKQTIPRLELVISLILAKLMAHVKDALHCFTINRIDSMIVFYWLDNKRTWSQYVRNEVRKIQELSKVEWKHVTTYQNLSDTEDELSKVEWKHVTTYQNLSDTEDVGQQRSQRCGWKDPNGCMTSVNGLSRRRLLKQMKLIKKRSSRNL